jgi:hypothetical protein
MEEAVQKTEMVIARRSQAIAVHFLLACGHESALESHFTFIKRKAKQVHFLANTKIPNSTEAQKLTAND